RAPGRSARHRRTARHGDLRGDCGEEPRPAHVPDRLSAGGVAACAQERPGPGVLRPVRALHRRPRDRQRVQRAQRPRRPAGPLRGAAPGQARGRPRDHGIRRGLLPGARHCHAPGRRRGDRHRSPDDAAHRADVDPGCHPFPVDASGMTGFEGFVAWRYLRSKGSKAGRITILVGAGLLVVALAFYITKKHFEGIHPFQLTPTQDTLKIVAHWVAIGSLALGIMVIVFGIFRSLQSIFTTISSFGVFLGTAALVIVLSVMNGFEADLRKKILGSNAHVLVAREWGEFSEWRDVEKK